MKDPKSAGHCFGQELLVPPPRMANWKRKQKRFSEADVRGGILLKSEFPDPEGLFHPWGYSFSYLPYRIFPKIPKS
jgi:hypothetical protein